MDADLKLLKQAALVLAASLAVAAPGRAQQLLVSSASVVLNNNQAQSIQVTASGTPSLAYALSGVPLWLSTFSANNFTTPDTLYFQLANTSCGTCMATVTLTPATGAPVTVTVTYAPGGTTGVGTLVASPLSLTFTAQAGQGAASQTVVLSTSSPTSIFISGIASDQTSWLSAAITGGSFAINSSSSATLTVSATASSLANGTYTGHITITPSVGAAVTITVTFNVGTGSGGPIVATPASLTFISPFPQILTAQNVTLTTASATPVAIAGINADVTWLAFSLTSGNGLISSTSPATLSVSVSAAGLSNGTFTGHITILPSVGSATVITVTLTLGSGAGTITASQSSFQFAYPGNALSAPVNIGSSNPAVTTFNVNVSSQSNWLIFQGITGSFTGLTLGTYTISVNAAVASGLATGLYSGTIALINPQNPADTTTINLTLMVNGGTGGVLTVTPSALSFLASPGGAAQSQNLNVTVPANAAVQVNITSNNGPFFSVSSPACSGSPNGSFSCTFTGSQTLTVTVNPGSLATAGLYTGSLLFQSGGSTVSVPLTLNLTAAVTALSANPSALSFTAAAGSPPQTAIVAVSVPGNAVVQASLTSYNGDFFTVNSANCNADPVSSPTCAFSGNQTLTVTVNPSSLTSPGVYNGIIQLQSGGVTVNVTVSLTLTGSGTGGFISAIAAPATLTFAYQANASVTPPQQVVTVGAVGTFSAAETVSSTQQWLNISSVGSTGPGYVIVSVSPQGLAVGTYAGSVFITSASGNMTIPVTLKVTTGIVVESAPATVNIPYQTGAPPVPQTLTIFASDSSATPVNAASSTPWITVQSQSATTTPATVQLAINPAGLCNGLNTGAVTIAAPNAGNSGFTVPVVALVTGSTAAGCGGASGPLMLVPPTLTFTAQANGPLPPTQILQVIAPTPSTSYSVSAALPLPSGVPNWLTVQPSGTLTGSQSLVVSVNQTGLAPGTYSLPIALITNGAVQSVPVTLIVGQPGGLIGLTATPSSLTFTAQSGQSAGSQNVTLSNTTSTTINILGISTDSPNFLSAAVTAGPFAVSPGAPPTTLTVTATAARLPVGTVVGHITVNTSSGPIQITVTVNVTSASVTGTIVASPASLVFSAPAGQTAPTPAQIVTLIPASNVPVSLVGTPTTDVSWLSVSVNTLTVSPSSPGILTVVANASSLATGFYVGHITITPAATPLATSPTIIGVTFLVPPPNPGIGTITASQTSLQFVSPGATSALVSIGTSNPSITTFNVAVASQPNWLLFGNNPSGTYFGLPFGSFLVRVDPAVAGNLPAGGYTGSITLINPQNPSDITIVTVTLIVAGGTNLSQGKTATESSTLPGYPTAGAASAVDGNTDGNFFDGSVTATNLDPNPWWQVDLGATVTVNSVLIWNRTDCCSSRLSDYWVFLSNTPFLPTDTPANLQFRAGTQALHLFNAPNPPGANIFGNLQARYVRVQLSNAGYLSLAEVQVFGIGAPLISNMALGKQATQSSTLPGYPTAGAGAAVDGNTDGSFFDGSVTATNLDPNPWWQVDLGVSVAVGSITLWNRTDCCGSRLSDYWVFVSDTPFLPTDTPATLQFRLGTFSTHQTSAPNPSTIIAPVAQGRYVRVQLTGAGYLSLAEVQVFGVPAVAAADLALGQPAAQSSTLPGFPTAVASAAVDGSTDGVFYDGSVTATNLDPNPWWQVDLGAPHAVNSVVVWNRTDCCSARLSDYWVFVSNTPFLPTDTPATLQFRLGTFGTHQTTAPNPSAPIAVGMQGQYVRVQLSNAGYLSLAEVQVLGQ